MSVIELLWEFADRARTGRASARVARDFEGRIREAINPPIMSRKQCAEFLGVGLTTLDHYVKWEGLPRHFRDGPNTKKRPAPFFLQSEVLEWQLRHQSFPPRN